MRSVDAKKNGVQKALGGGGGRQKATKSGDFLFFDIQFCGAPFELSGRAPFKLVTSLVGGSIIFGSELTETNNKPLGIFTMHIYIQLLHICSYIKHDDNRKNTITSRIYICMC